MDLHKSIYDEGIASTLDVSLDVLYKVLKEFKSFDYQMFYFEMGKYMVRSEGETEIIDKYKKIFQKHLREEKLNRIIN